MRTADFGALLLAITLASAGCGGEDGGGSGGTGPATAFSFDADTSLEAGASAGTAVAIAVQFGAVVSNVFANLGSGLVAASPNLFPKAIVPGFYQTGMADLGIEQSLPGTWPPEMSSR